MTICDKIQTVGETIETNLNARGVSCTFGTGTGKKNILQMANLITANNLKGSADSIISIFASRPYLLNGEKTDLIVTLKNGLGEPKANASVTVSDGTSVYNGITNTNGLFTLYDVEVDSTTTFTASYGSVTDSVTVIYDCKFVDYGVIGNTNSNWVTVSGTDNKTVTSTGTTLANTTSTRYDIFANLGSTSSVYDFQSPFTVEFDIVGYVGTTARLQIYDTTNIATFNGIGGTGHWKIVVNGTTVKPYKDGVEQTNYTRNIQTARIGFIMPQDTSITYRNFAIY